LAHGRNVAGRKRERRIGHKANLARFNLIRNALLFSILFFQQRERLEKIEVVSLGAKKFC